MTLWGSQKFNNTNISYIDSGVFAYLSAAATTTITVANTWYPTEGTFVNFPLQNFEFATVITPGIKYTGTRTDYFLTASTMNFNSNNNNATVSTGIKLNGDFITSSKMNAFARYDDQSYLLSMKTVLELSTNDEIQLVLTSNITGEQITVNNYSLYITRFF